MFQLVGNTFGNLESWRSLFQPKFGQNPKELVSETSGKIMGYLTDNDDNKIRITDNVSLIYSQVLPENINVT